MLLYCVHLTFLHVSKMRDAISFNARFSTVVWSSYGRLKQKKTKGHSINGKITQPWIAFNYLRRIPRDYCQIHNLSITKWTHFMQKHNGVSNALAVRLAVSRLKHNECSSLNDNRAAINLLRKKKDWQLKGFSGSFKISSGQEWPFGGWCRKSARRIYATEG